MLPTKAIDLIPLENDSNRFYFIDPDPGLEVRGLDGVVMIMS